MPWKTRKRKLSPETFDFVHTAHIASFKGKWEYSHYSLKDKKTYLYSELNINKLYKEKVPAHNVSYEKYRTVFSEKFDISFGYPQKHTCSTCEIYTAQMRAIENGLKNFPEGSKERLGAEKNWKSSVRKFSFIYWKLICFTCVNEAQDWPVRSQKSESQLQLISKIPPYAKHYNKRCLLCVC